MVTFSGTISTDKGVRKYQLWKKVSRDEFVLLDSDYKSDLNSSDVDDNLEDLKLLRKILCK